MAREPSKTFTDREIEIMKIVWEMGEATAREIQARLSGERHYNSVMTIIRVLEAKGHLTHRAEGKSYVYRARHAPHKARRRALGHLIDHVFAGSAASLVLQLVETGDLTEEDLQDIRRQLNKRLAEKARKPKGHGGDAT
jgi:BlaI family penicillinase repressor